jgi:serine-type D-Ala-D-Ala carboxypeptidase (penicillin-binding protein 5/6)
VAPRHLALLLTMVAALATPAPAAAELAAARSPAAITPRPGATAAATPGALGGAARPRAAAGLRVASRYAILVDAGTDRVLWGRNYNVARPPASLTKMMTVLVANASLARRQVAVAGRDAAVRPATRLALRPGQKILVEQALAAALIVSANDMAVLLADTSAGSMRRFSLAMDAESRRLGLRRSRWRVPDGLDTPGHVSSAYDLAILARAVLRDPWLARMVRTRHLAFVTPDGHRHTLTSRSRFLRDYPGAVGIKTGFTDDAGRCLAAAATRGGRTLIAIVLDSPDPAGDAARLMDWGFAAGGAAGGGLRLPPYTPPVGVAALLPRPPAPGPAAAAPATTAAPALDQAADTPPARRGIVPVALTSATVLLVGLGSLAVALRRPRRRGSR